MLKENYIRTRLDNILGFTVTYGETGRPFFHGRKFTGAKIDKSIRVKQKLD